MTILYENNTYGRDSAHDLQEEARKELICVSQMLAITVSDNGDVSLDQMNAVLDEIMLQNPVTEGAVLFASKQVAQNILVAVNNKGVANVPLIILSESVGLQDDIFRLHGSILEKTKGFLSVSPSFTEITSFTDYWLSLFVNTTLFSEKAKMNPWLKGVFAAVTGCLQEPSSCPALTVEQARLKFPTQPVYVKYAILAAHAMSSALNRLYTDLCESDCLADFKNKFKRNMMIDQMKGLSIDFGSDFPGVTVEPLTSTRYKVTFGTESNPISLSDHDVYDVYNFKRSPDSMDPSDFSLTKVGQYTGFPGNPCVKHFLSLSLGNHDRCGAFRFSPSVTQV